MNPYGIIYEYDVTGAIGVSCRLPRITNEWYTAPIPAASPGYSSVISHQSSVIRRVYSSKFSVLGSVLLALATGGLIGPFIPQLRLEADYRIAQVLSLANHESRITNHAALPKAVPVVFDPLVTPDGASIDPISEDFAIVVPKVGINAKVIENVDPGKSSEYYEALEQGVAHANTSFLPDENGTVYLFSHSTNYDWFIKDLNAVFYHLKNLDKGDTVVLIYKGNRYTYKITGKKVVSPRDISYLVPNYGKKSLILQTCWPPGSVAQRLLIFADLTNEQGKQT